MASSSSTIDLKAIIGLGNPGSKYTKTRHNAGFWFVEGVVNNCAGNFTHEAKFQSDVASCFLEGKKVWCQKPATFMNLSGQAVRSLTSFYRIDASEILVAHDEIDLPAGTIKIKFGGGHGGHNGLRDIISHLGTKDFYRLRIGVGHPGNKQQVPDYVLKQASLDDQIAIDNCIDDALKIVPTLAQGSVEKAMHVLHSK